AEIERQIPRDPDLDPARIQRGYLALVAVVAAATSAAAALIHGRGFDRTVETPRDLGAVGAGMLGGITLAALALRRRLGKNLYGRGVLLLFACMPAAILAHRAVGAAAGMSVTQLVVGDLVVFAVVFGVVGITMERWAGWIAIITLACAVAGAYAPS